MCSALLEAEVSECSMGGNLCGYSTGEALSRWCAMSVAPGVLDAFATAPTWAADGTPNFVDVTDPTDQDPDSTGCGMAFLSWLQSMGYTLPTIARAMVTLGDGATLAAVWGALTDKDEAQAWPTFQIAVSGLAGGVTSDDPFAGASAPVPAPAPQPPLPAPPPAPGAAVTLANAQGWAAQGLAAAWPPGAH